MSGRKRDVRRTWPTNAFAAIVDADGSITQGEALANAATEIRALPDVGVKGIDAAISAIGSLVALADHDSLDADDLQRILGHVDRILMLSHAFGFDRLERISRYIGDLCLGFSRLGNRPAEPVSVFVRAAMLFQPDRTDMSDQDAETVFAELQKGANRYMGLAPKPCNEAFRQSVLDSLDIMESPAEAAFDRLT